MHQPPLIITLAFEKEAFDYFNTLRKQYFPAERNFIDAHITLFHALPNIDSVFNTARRFAIEQKVFDINIVEPFSLGKGVAFLVISEDLIKLHKKLQTEWLELLTQQDKQKLKPHITIQNKVMIEEAKELLLKLKASYLPITAKAYGLQIWEYHNGPWKLLEDLPFKN